METDVRTLRAFFDQNQFLTNIELAQLASKSIHTIRRWKRKCGLDPHTVRDWGNGTKSRPFAYSKEPASFDLVARDVWDTAEWLREHYVDKKLGIRLIGKMTGANNFVIHKKLKKYGIERRQHVPHKCCSYQWLSENYEVLGYSIRKCARLAGVNPYTIYNWLIKFQIQIRDKLSAQAGERSHLYGKTAYVKHRDRKTPDSYIGQ